MLTSKELLFLNVIRQQKNLVCLNTIDQPLVDILVSIILQMDSHINMLNDSIKAKKHNPRLKQL